MWKSYLVKMSSEGKQLVLAQVARRGSSSGFYVVDLEADKAWKTPIATAVEFAGDIGIVCLGSFVYYLGSPTAKGTVTWNQLRKDGHHLSMGTSYFEFSSKQKLLALLESKEGEGKEWDADDDPFKAGPTLLSCIGEVFTPGTGEWKSLAQPQKDLPLKQFCVSYPVFADEKNKRLLVHFNNVRALYAYYPAAGNVGGQWDCLAPDLKPWKRVSTLFDNSHSRQGGTSDCIAAYDVMTRSWLKVVYSVPFPYEVYTNKFENMLCLGDGMLCLAGCFPVHKNRCIAHCYVLRQVQS
ncbi:hypothetical protein V2J09_008247 [Rumex salicifolius]